MSGILEVTIRFRRRVSSLSSRVESDDAVEGVDVEVVGEGVELSSMGDVRGVGARLSLGPNERSIGPQSTVEAGAFSHDWSLASMRAANGSKGDGGRSSVPKAKEISFSHSLLFGVTAGLDFELAICGPVDCGTIGATGPGLLKPKRLPRLPLNSQFV